MKKGFLLLVACLLTLGIIACQTTSAELSIENKDVSLEVGETHKLDVKVVNDDDPIFSYKVVDPSIVRVEKGIVTALREGETDVEIGVKYVKGNKVTVHFTVKDNRKISLSADSVYLKAGETTKLEILPKDVFLVDDTCVWSSSDPSVATVKDGIVKAIGAGTAIISVEVDGLKAEITIAVEKEVDVIKPEFILGEGIKDKNFLNWNKPFNPLDGIQAVDNVDGDITSKIEVVGEVDNQTYGFYELTYRVQDEAGNKAEFKRTIEVVWNYDVTFIGHAGSYYGLMNSEEAFLYAVQVLKYQALECDLKQTSDGVFVMSHDETFGGYTISTTPWSVLKDVEVTKSRKAGFPAQNGSVTKDTYTTKLCTLERYLEICRQYNAKAVIELKSSAGITNSDQSRMQALMDEIEKAGMREDTIFLGSQYNCLIWTRENGYSDVECQYLVNSCESDTILERCKKYDLDVSINVTASYSNSEEWLAKYKEAGLKISTYTFTQYVDYPTVQEWIDKGADYVTCDWQLMSKLTLPESSNDPDSNITHKVIFKDYDGKVLKEAVVKDGRAAAAPKDPTRLGYRFTGWDKSIVNVKQDFEVTALYEICEYTITYDKNLTTIIKSKWNNKDEFVNELYTDLYNWFITNAEYISTYVQVQNGKVTITKNGQTTSFSNVEELKAIDIYVFEKTVSNFIYQPVKRDSEGKAVIEHSESYFLNSDAYREKYQAMDQYFYNAVKNGYPAYDNTYTPTSAGKIQILFRFHQWVKGTTIAAFNELPAKYIVKDNNEVQAELPTTNLKYTVEDEFDLPSATANVNFLGWFLDRECTIAITKITKGMTGNLVLYAKWEYTIPVVNSKITFELDGGEFEEGYVVPTTYEEGKELVLATPVKEGYIFLGWTLEKDSTEYITSISAAQTGDVTVYAAWKEEAVAVDEILVGPNEEYKTIKDALLVATANTKIYVKSGTYSEDLVIAHDGIQLIGPNSGIDGTSDKRAVEAIISGKITISKNLKDVKILGFNLTNTTSVYGEGDNENIVVKYNVIEGTAASAGTSGAGIGQIHFVGAISNLVVEHNKFTLKSNVNYYSCVYSQGLITGAEINHNYVTNNCPTSQNVFAFWLRNAAGVINMNENIAYRFAGNYWTFWVGQDKLAENTKITMRDNNFDSDSAANAECGMAVHHAEYESIEINYIGNTFSYCKDTVFSVQGKSTTDTTSTPHVTIMYNKILNTSARMRFCVNAKNFYFGKNYSALAYTDQGTPNIKAAEIAKDDFKSTMELDDAYAETKMCAINYELDGGTLPEGAPTKYLPGYATRLVAPTKDGYKFLGWSLTKDGNKYITLIPETATGDLTLYAIFKEIKPSLMVGEGQTYKTLEEALAAATDGDTIEFVSGTYAGGTIAKSVTIIGPNKDINPNKDTRQNEAIFTSDLIIEANNVEINGITLTGEARIVGSESTSIENLTINYILFDNSKVAGSKTAPFYFVPATGVSYKNVVIKYSRINKGTGRQMILYGSEFENLTITNNEFYGPYQTYNDGIKIDDIGAFGTKGEINISDNVFDGYQQYVIWFLRYSYGNYTIESNKYNNIGLAEYHAGVTFKTYSGSKDDELKINYRFNKITNGYMLFRFEEAKVLNGDNCMINVNYNIRENCSGDLFVKNVNPDVIVNADKNYWGTTTLLEKNFLNVTTYADAYQNAQDVPSKEEVEGGSSETKIYSKIIYVLDGGEVSASTRYLEGKEYILPIPTKEDYRFVGWSLTPDGSQIITAISTTTTGDVTVYAIWEAVEYYNITYIYNGGYSNEGLYQNRGENPIAITINNYNNSDGSFWSGSKYATDIFITDSSCDPKATFSDRIYIAKNKENGLYEVVSFLQSGASSWPEGAEYVISISNSYNAYYLNIKPITNKIKVGQYVVFGGNIESINNANPTEVCFFDELPTCDQVTVKVGTNDELIKPGLLGYKFLGWFENDKLITSISELKGDTTLSAKWEALNPATGIKIDAFKDEMLTNEEFQIIASIEPSDAYFKTVYYESSNTDILQVTSTGLVKAINVGTAKITMRDYMSLVVVEREITVYSHDSIDASFEGVYNGTIKPEDTLQLNVKAYGKNAASATFIFESLNPEIVSVSATGLITALKDGYAEILIKTVGMEANLTIGVTVKSLGNETSIDKLLSLLVNGHFSTVQSGNVSLYNDGTTKVFVPTYGSVNRFLFDEYVVNETYYAKTEENPNNHKDRRDVDTIEFVTIHDTATLTGTVESIAQVMSSGETSIHYTVGNDAIFGVVPEKYIAYHAGDGTKNTFVWTKTNAKATQNVKPEYDVVNVDGKYYLSVNNEVTTITIPSTGTKEPTKDLFTHLGPVWKVIDGYYYIGGPLWYSDYGRISSFGGNCNSIGIEMCVNTSGDIYDTWQRTAMLVADILIRNNLDPTRVKQHNTWSGKNCPQSVIEGSFWQCMMEMIELQYEVRTKYKDAKISIVSHNPEIVDNTGRVISAPEKTTTVSYTLKVELNGETREIKLYSVIPGTTTWEQWNGSYPASRIWNNKVYAR